MNKRNKSAKSARQNKLISCKSTTYPSFLKQAYKLSRIALLLLLFGLTTMAVHAQKFKEGGLWYEITASDKVKVTYQKNGYPYWDDNQKPTGTIDIPQKVRRGGTDYKVIRIGDHAFFGCKGIELVNISNTVRYIERSAFASCTSLQSIDIPNSVIQVGEYAFSYCTSLTSVNIPNSLTSIEKRTFIQCESLTSIDIPGSVTSIEYTAFQQCSSLTAINVATDNTAYSSEDGVLFNKSKTKLWKYPIAKSGNSYSIPNSVTEIMDYAFVDCANLASVNIPGSVTSIGDGVFRGCANLTSVNIPGSVTSIGDGVFNSCSSLTAINVATDNTAYSSEDGVLFNKSKTKLWKYPIDKSGNSYSIPNYVTEVMEDAFKDCTNLTSIDISGSVTSIDLHAFDHCTNLTAINVATDNTAYSSENGVLFDKSKNTLIKYPFAKPATTYTIPEPVTTVEYCAFDDCLNLVSISIPATISDIKSYAFSSENLEKIISYKQSVTDITMSDYVFSSVDKTLCKLYVPVGSVSAYENAEQWEDFDNILAIENVTGVAFNTTNYTVDIFASLNLAPEITIAPSNASNDIITWSSSNPAIASVDENGIVTGCSPGNATITATTAEGGFTAACNVEVVIPSNMRYITLTVADGKDIELVMAADADNTDIKIISGSKMYTETVGTIWLGPKDYKSEGNTMTIYGNIKQFRCQSNHAKITGLDASGNTNLEVLYCSRNEITNLNISNNTTLTLLDCHRNKLQNLDISGNTNLTQLNCRENQLKNLNLSKNTELLYFTCSDNQFQNLDLSHNTKLKQLNCSNNQLASLDLSNNNDLINLKCNGNQLASLDLSNNNELNRLFCYNNAFTTRALDLLYCSLPDKAASDNANIYPAYNSSDAGYANVEASTTTNATNKNWTVKFQDGGAAITGTGGYICGTVTSVTLTPATKTIEIGNTFDLIATVEPSNATNPTVTWSSNNTAVATVDNTGKVTAVKEGTATITVTTEDGGKTATCVVTVTPKTIAVTAVTLDISTKSLVKGKSFTLTATVTPSNATNKNVTWSSNKPAVATVDNTGKVTGVAVGKATITATTEDGSKTATCEVTVTSATAIKDISNTLQFNVYPTIVNTGFTVEFADKFNNGLILEIYSLSGMQVHTERVNKDKQYINISNLQAGTYIIRLGNQTCKIIKK